MSTAAGRRRQHRSRAFSYFCTKYIHIFMRVVIIGQSTRRANEPWNHDQAKARASIGIPLLHPKRSPQVNAVNETSFKFKRELWLVFAYYTKKVYHLISADLYAFINLIISGGDQDGQPKSQRSHTKQLALIEVAIPNGRSGFIFRPRDISMIIPWQNYTTQCLSDNTRRTYIFACKLRRRFFIDCN